MRGMIYKEICLFYKSFDRRLLLIIGGILAFLLFKLGPYAGFLASIMFAVTIGMQCVMTFASDERVDWKKYQMAMPVSGYQVVAGRYLSVVSILVVGIGASFIFNLFSSMIYGQWDFGVWGLSILSSILVPLILTGIGLPLAYWLGFRASQVMGILYVFPMVHLISFFEDGTGLSELPSVIMPYLGMGVVAVVLIFGVSYIISVMGYYNKRQFISNR